MSYKVSVESVGEADADDVLIALINSLFRRNSRRSWLYFGLGLLACLSVTLVFWLNGRFLIAAVFSATALVLVVFRIIGLSGDRSAARTEWPDESHIQV